MSSFLKSDIQSAYTQAFQTALTSKGRVMTGEIDPPVVNIADSVPAALFYIQQSLSRRSFCAICLGEPGVREEMLASLREFGAWVGKDVPNRQRLLAQIKQVREACTDTSWRTNALAQALT